MNSVVIPRVITGDSVDLLSPFPPVYIDRLVKWTHQFKSLLSWDLGPQTDEEIKEHIEDTIANRQTFAVIDKYNLIGLPNPTGPIVVGAFILDVASPVNIYMHVVSQRRVWGKGLIDEAVDVLIKDLFDSNEILLRLSATMVKTNRAVVSFAKRHKFKHEGTISDMLLVNGQPVDVVHMGLTRRDYLAGQAPAEV